MEDPRIISALFIFLKMAYYNVLINNICFYMQASRTLDCTDSDIISETCKIHSLTFPSNYLILGLDFSMPLAPSFHIVLVNKLLPFAM